MLLNTLDFMIKAIKRLFLEKYSFPSYHRVLGWGREWSSSEHRRPGCPEVWKQIPVPSLAGVVMVLAYGGPWPHPGLKGLVATEWLSRRMIQDDPGAARSLPTNQMTKTMSELATTLNGTPGHLPTSLDLAFLTLQWRAGPIPVFLLLEELGKQSFYNIYF